MIFFAVAAPTPGRLSKSFSLAVFRSTPADVFAWLLGLAVVELGDLGSLDGSRAEAPTAKALNAISATAEPKNILRCNLVISFSF